MDWIGSDPNQDSIHCLPYFNDHISSSCNFYFLFTSFYLLNRGGNLCGGLTCWWDIQSRLVNYVEKFNPNPNVFVTRVSHVYLLPN